MLISKQRAMQVKKLANFILNYQFFKLWNSNSYEIPSNND